MYKRQAPLLSGREKEPIFVFADERLPETYASISNYPNAVCAIALRLSTDAQDAICELDLSPLPEGNSAADQALTFLKTRLPQ